MKVIETTYTPKLPKKYRKQKQASQKGNERAMKLRRRFESDCVHFLSHGLGLKDKCFEEKYMQQFLSLQNTCKQLRIQLSFVNMPCARMKETSFLVLSTLAKESASIRYLFYSGFFCSVCLCIITTEQTYKPFGEREYLDLLLVVIFC